MLFSQVAGYSSDSRFCVSHGMRECPGFCVSHDIRECPHVDIKQMSQLVENLIHLNSSLDGNVWPGIQLIEISWAMQDHPRVNLRVPSRGLGRR